MVGLSALLLSPFLSTPSARRATARRTDRQYPHPISIHALREEGDNWMLKGLMRPS